MRFALHASAMAWWRIVLITATVAVAAAASAALADDDGDATPGRHDRTTSHSPPRRLRTTVTIGYSVDHRPIRAIRVGAQNAPRSVLVVGCIHGDERAGIAIARRLAAHAPLPGTALWIVPVLNPDGATANTRQNADGVDLNRNFPYRWRPLGPRGSQQYAGTHPLSAPEARTAFRLILRIRPAISIWYHQPLGVVDLSGGNPALERRYAHLVSLPIERLIRYPGSVSGWENHRFPGTTAFVVELPPGRMTSSAAARYARGAVSLFRAP